MERLFSTRYGGKRSMNVRSNQLPNRRDGAVLAANPTRKQIPMSIPAAVNWWAHRPGTTLSGNTSRIGWVNAMSMSKSWPIIR